MMEDLSKNTPTELLKLAQDAKAKHEQLKSEIVVHTQEIEELEKIINEKLTQLTEAETEYVLVVEEIDKR